MWKIVASCWRREKYWRERGGGREGKEKEGKVGKE